MADLKATGASQGKQTLVEEGTHFKGSLVSTCPIVVRGRIEGDTETPSLTVSETGAVHGRVKVGTVVSSGEIAGEFDANTVQLSGRVNDNTVIRAQTLEVKLSTTEGKMEVVFGNARLEVGDDPAKPREEKEKKGKKGEPAPEGQPA